MANPHISVADALRFGSFRPRRIKVMAANYGYAS
jgi:hypothetical protein